MPHKATTMLRLQDWWTPKLPVLLSVAYAGLADGNAVGATWDLLLVLASLIVGAAYVSLLNDYTDLEADRLAGKANRMAGMPPALRLPLLLTVVAIGVGFSTWLLPHPLALIAYVTAWLSFTAYSTPPLRLKARGFLGVLADAAGAHVFPSIYLYAIASTMAIHATQDTATEIVAITLWALALGIRGNLWHQLADRDSDKKSGTTTFGTRPDAVRKSRAWTPLLLSLEFGSLIILIVHWQIIHMLYILPFYLMMVWARRRIWRIPTSALLPRKKARFLFAEIYSTILPWVLLFEIAENGPHAWIYLVPHLLLFGRADLAALIECARLFADPRWARAAVRDSRRYFMRLRA
jgi:4-hydroxybenzoate polyprenyltransferase